RDTDATFVLRTRAPFVGHGLCRLAFPEDFGVSKEAPDFALWTSGLGACILEAFQRDLAARWIEVEREKARITAWQQMRTLGQSQTQTLNAFLDAAEAARRLDLTRFLLHTLAEVLEPRVTGRSWVAGLQNAGPRMIDRTETNQAALALVLQA